jgi:hypothetical protein
MSAAIWHAQVGSCFRGQLLQHALGVHHGRLVFQELLPVFFDFRIDGEQDGAVFIRWEVSAGATVAAGWVRRTIGLAEMQRIV